MSLEAIQTVPHNIEAERTVLGAVLLDNQAWDTLVEKLSRDDFYVPANRTVFESMQRLSTKGKPIDMLTLKNDLVTHNSLEGVGGAAFLASLVDGLPRLTNVGQWAQIVRDKAVARGIIRAAGRMADVAGQGGDTNDMLEVAIGAVMAVADSVHATGGFSTPQAAAKEAMAMIDAICSSTDGVVGTRTGLTEFDNLSGGLTRGNLIIAAARPGMGKSAFAGTVGDNIAMAGGKVACFSLEMNKAEWTARRMAKRSGVCIDMLRHLPRSREESVAKLVKTYEGISRDAFFVNDTPAMTLEQIRSSARRIRSEQKGLDLVIVDYLQLITGKGEIGGNREQFVSGLSRGLKNLAKELDVPVLALAQLNRDVEKRENKRPQLSDLRESGGIEQDADVIAFLYRDCVYKPDSDRESAEIIVRKNRNGTPFDIDVRYVPEITTFMDPTPQQVERWAGQKEKAA